MITSMCVTYNDLWPWPISSRLFSCSIAYVIDYIQMWHKYNPRGDDVSCTISRSTGHGHTGHLHFCSWEGGWGGVWEILVSVWNSVNKVVGPHVLNLNHKLKIEEKSTKSSQSSKVVGLGPADLWEFPTLILVDHWSQFVVKYVLIFFQNNFAPERLI